MSRRHTSIGLAAALLASVVPIPMFAAPEQKYPDVLAVKVSANANGTFNFDVTVSSPYDTAQRYGDAFRARSPDNKVFGERELLHDHATEQPFTRDLYGVKIAPAIKSVVIEARDKKYGYGGETVVVMLPGR